MLYRYVQRKIVFYALCIGQSLASWLKFRYLTRFRKVLSLVDDLSDGEGGSSFDFNFGEVLQVVDDTKQKGTAGASNSVLTCHQLSLGGKYEEAS